MLGSSILANGSYSPIKRRLRKEQLQCICALPLHGKAVQDAAAKMRSRFDALPNHRCIVAMPRKRRARMIQRLSMGLRCWYRKIKRLYMRL